MSNHVIRCIVLMPLLLLLACHQQKKEKVERDKKILELSKNIMGDREYDQVFKQVLDTLKSWEEAKLGSFKWAWALKYKLDSVLCFNTEKDRMVTAILVQCDKYTCQTDNIEYFYGAKIKGQWYFFDGGGTMVVLRKNYQSDISIPVSFEKLHELAMKEMLRGYVKKNKTGVWEINNTFFIAHFEGVNWGDFNKQSPKDTLPNGQHFTNKKEFFENIYLRVAKSN